MSATLVETEPVSFASDGRPLRGELFFPANGRAPDALPAVVVSGTWTSVRQQMADRYARELAARGFAALSFDFTGYGASDGEPRDIESAALKARDIIHAVSFLAEHPKVDGERIVELAVCASAMYAALNAVEDARVRALAMVAPWLHDGRLVREMYGGQDGVAQRVAAGERARERYEDTGVVDYVPAQSRTDPAAAMPMVMDFYENPDRGRIPQWDNKFAVLAWPEWLTLDSIALAPQLTTPTILVHSEDAAIPDGARRFHDAIGGAKEIAWTNGSQFDFYDQPAAVGQAVERAAAFFERYG